MTTRGKTAPPHLGIKWTVRPPQRPTWPVGTPLSVPVITTVGRQAGTGRRSPQVHAVDLRLRDLTRISRFVNEVRVDSGNCLFKQAG